MRTLSANALIEIAKRFGSEPISLIEIEWEEGSTTTYADKDVDAQIHGKILELSEIQMSLRGDNAQITNFSVTLDDTDGSIKAIVDSTNVHKRKCNVYQYFGDLALDDKFKVIEGEVSTPFQWGEGDRQLSFSIGNQVEAFEVGFSPEEGQLDFVSENLEGRPWPLCFGHVVHVPAQKVTQIEEATTRERFSIRDPMLIWKLQRIEQAYQLEAFMLRFWELVRNGIYTAHPRVWWTLREYVRIIIMERIQMAAINAKINEINQRKVIVQQNPGNVGPRAGLAAAQAQLDNLVIVMQMIIARKKWLEEVIKLIKFYYDLDKRATKEQIAAYNNMRRLYGLWVETSQEICRQNQNFKNPIAVQNGDVFPDGEPVDVFMGGIKWNVQFGSGDMEFLVGPLPKYTNIPVDAWQVEDEPCANSELGDGLDLFWLEDDPPCNLEGMYLLVEKAEEDPLVLANTREIYHDRIRHVIKVRKQVGQKVYFDLVRWNESGGEGQPKGLKLENVIRKIVEPAGGWVLGPFGGVIPAGFFTGNLDPNVWNRPETALLLAIVSMIPGGVNKEELENLALLVYLLEFDLPPSLVLLSPTPREMFTIIGPDVAEIKEASKVPLEHWFNYEHNLVPQVEWPDEAFIDIEPNSPIRSDERACELFIANLLPSSIVGVHAYRTNEHNERFLAPVPESYYTKNEAAPLGTYTVTSLTTHQPLREIPGEGWEGEIYVSLKSSVGRNVVDVLEWLINTYTDASPNAANFAAMHTVMTNYPVDFALFERPNALEEIYRICWESRLGIWLRNGEFFLKYLAVEPDADVTLTEAEIQTQSMVVHFTSTEGLVTRMIATYDKDYLPLETGERKPRRVLRHNVKQYGLQSSAEHFHIYSITELVEKSATFWLIRKSNTWKRFSVKLFQPHFQLEPLDTALLDFDQTFLADVDTKVVIERLTFDTNTNMLSIDCLTPIRTGEMEVYPFFWPAALEAGTDWPTVAEIELGFAGGYGPGAGVTGTIDDCPEDNCGD